jgi:predicted nucleic acid-binding protein
VKRRNKAWATDYLSHYTALLDANVLYPAPLRDLFLQLALTGLFKARWSADIHREWIEALVRNQPERDRAALERTRDLMDTAARDSLVTGYEALIGTLSLPDPDDQHVLAAAIIGRCDVIVTQNLKHFPPTALEPFDIEVRHPDEFLCDQLSLAPGVVCGAVHKVRARLLKPPYSVEEYLATLRRQGLIAMVSELQSLVDLL